MGSGPMLLVIRSFKICLALGFFTVLGLESAFAEMSVNGFFPADYVRTDVFDENTDSLDNKFFHSSNATARVVAAKNISPKVVRVRSHSGRFSKTSRGTHRSSVQQSEWDVSPIISRR